MSTAIGAPVVDIVSTIDVPETISPSVSDDGAVSFSFEAPPGLYQLSIVMDAAGFDFEQLYEILNKHGNVNRRTGPWDFSINFNNSPLVPSYWVSVNGERIGLWFFSRISLEDLEHRRFRGNTAFYADGPTTVELEPFTPAELLEGQKPYDWSGLRWASAVLQPDPEDCLVPLPAGIKQGSDGPASRWGESAFWQPIRDGLDGGDYALYSEPLRRAFDAVTARESHGAEDILLLLAAHHIGQREGTLDMALAAVDAVISQEAWGNPNPEGYSHNGDMGAATCLRALAWAYHAFGDELGEERRARLLDKLRRHGEMFFGLALLNRDYWGGSILQDHGWKSLFIFGAAALHSLGVLPEADRWVSYVIPRLRRSLEAMPRDGVIPLSSWRHLYLWLSPVTHYRDALLALTGEDIFDQPQFAAVTRYCIATLDEPGHQLLSVGAGADRSPFIGGAHFLNRIAQKNADAHAAYLQQYMLQLPELAFYHGTEIAAYSLTAVEGVLTYDPATQLAPEKPVPPRFSYFHDSGYAQYRDDLSRAVLSVQCAPYAGFNAYMRSLNPCDRLGVVPEAGHFAFYLDGTALLCSPDAGYALRSATRSVLLIDDRGQRGDIGYPMSIPSKLHNGEQIQLVRWDDESGSGLVRLWLTPAYPESAGLSLYTRDFIIAPDRAITIRDTIVLDEPRRLSWLFQGKQEFGVALDGLTGILGHERTVALTPAPVEFSVTAAIHPTDIVWSYASASGFKPFEHIRYDATEPLRTAVIDFVLRWGS